MSGSEEDHRIHRGDCAENTAQKNCMGCELALAYDAIRALMAQRTNPQRDAEDGKEWDNAVNLGMMVLPEFVSEKNHLPDQSGSKYYLDAVITVCDSCLKASCWQGKFPCDYHLTVGTKHMTRRDLIELGLEHIDYLMTDVELATGGDS